MCCKQRTPSRKSTTTTTTTTAAAPPRTNRHRSLVNKSMPPPHPKSTSQADQPVRQASPEAAAVLSLGQISTILDPFFDTCTAVRRQRRQQQSRAAAATTTPAATATTPTTANIAQRKFLALPPHEEGSLSAVSGGAEDGCVIGGAESAASDSGRALQDFLGSGNSAWVDMVQEMEAEKLNDSNKAVSRSVNVIAP